MKTIWVALAAMTMAAPMHAQLVINEVMQSNIDCIMDDMNEFPDSWVELYNNGESSEQLSNYSIGLTTDAQKAWALPASLINKGYRVLIYCDKAASGMHTDFRLESGKNGEIYLFKNNKVVDKLTKMKKQPAPNIAYGRKTDGSDTWDIWLYQHQAVPTADLPARISWAMWYSANLDGSWKMRRLSNSPCHFLTERLQKLSSDILQMVANQ